jgi:hypothetical protein
MNMAERSIPQNSIQHHSSQSARRVRDGLIATISQGQEQHGGTAHSKGHLAHLSQKALEAKRVAKLQF